MPPSTKRYYEEVLRVTTTATSTSTSTSRGVATQPHNTGDDVALAHASGLPRRPSHARSSTSGHPDPAAADAGTIPPSTGGPAPAHTAQPAVDRDTCEAPVQKRIKLASNGGSGRSSPRRIQATPLNPLPLLTLQDLYAYLSFRLLQLSEGEFFDRTHAVRTSADLPPPFVVKNEFLERTYTLLLNYLKDPTPFVLMLSNFTDTPHLPLSQENLETLLLLARRRQSFDLHLCAPEYEEVAHELTALDCQDKFLVYVYVSHEHMRLRRWQEPHPHVHVRPVGRLPAAATRHGRTTDGSALDFWDTHLVRDRQVLYHDTKDGEYHMERNLVGTPKLAAEVMDYAIAWNIFGVEAKPSSIIIFTNHTSGIQNLVPTLMCHDTWAIHPRSAEEFRIIKAWIFSYCF